MIYSLRHPKRAVKKSATILDYPSTQTEDLLKEIARLQALVSQTGAVPKSKLVKSNPVKNPSHWIDVDQCGYPIKYDLNPKLEPIFAPLTIDSVTKAELLTECKTRETIATLARRSALSVGVPPRKLR